MVFLSFFQCSLSKFSLSEVSRASIQQLFKMICEKYISERDVYSTSSVFLLILPLKVDNTDAEGRLLLADALCYAHNFNARAIVNAATLTGKQRLFPAHFEVSFVLLMSWAGISHVVYINPTLIQRQQMILHVSGQQQAQLVCLEWGGGMQGTCSAVHMRLGWLSPAGTKSRKIYTDFSVSAQCFPVLLPCLS